MIKKNKITMIITSVLTVLPIVFGLFMWNILPDTITTHWGINGEPDGWSSKAFTIIFIPIFLLAVHWICIFVTAFCTKEKDAGKKAINMVLWICPVIALVCMSMVYAVALGMNIDIGLIAPLLVGIMFIIIGNYLPKCKRNYVIGIKMPWTLNSDENWYHTHRFGGALWVMGGIVMIVTALLKMPVISFIVIFLLIIIPIVYSYVYYLKYEKK